MSTLAILAQSLGLATNSHLTAEQLVLKRIICHCPQVDHQQPLRDIRFVVLDTETTGLKPKKGDRVISLGAVIVENGKVNESKSFYELVDPGRAIPGEITKLTGISQRMVAGKPDLTEVLNRFFPWAGKSVLAGHAVQFDMTFLNRHLQKTCGLKLTHKTIDTKTLARHTFPEAGSYALEEICSYLGITCKPRHHALNDAITAARLLEASITVLAQQGVCTLGEWYHFMRYHSFSHRLYHPWVGDWRSECHS